jgi:histidine phosphotransfer protein HptB
MPLFERPVLDHAVLAEIRSLGADFLDEIVAVFVVDAAARLARLHAVCTAGAGDAIRKEAHGLKGGALGVGAARMAEICSAIEQNAGTGRIAEAVALESSLDPAFDEARRALEELCRCRPAV